MSDSEPLRRGCRFPRKAKCYQTCCHRSITCCYVCGVDYCAEHLDQRYPDGAERVLCSSLQAVEDESNNE